MGSKMKSLFAGVVMTLVILLLPKSILAAETISVTTVEDITDVKDVTSTNYQIGTGNYSNLVKFTLKKPAYVYVSAYSTICYENWDNLGIIEKFAVYSDAKCSNLVTGDSVTSVQSDKRYSKYLCLDAGDYWVYFAKGDAGKDEYAAASSGEFRLSVAAEYLDVNGTKNGSWKRAKSISTDKDVKGYLSSNTRTSWFKFTISDSTTAQLRLSLENPLGEKLYPTSKVGVTVYRSNKSIIERVNITDAYYESVYSSSLSLSKGTYYIAITGDTSYSPYNNKKLEANDHTNMGVVNLKITTINKGTLSSVTNEKGKKAKVTFKSISGAKGYEIQYSTDKNFKNAKTKNAGSKSTSVTLSSLTKNKKYYVRVRGFKYNADGDKVYGAWSSSKNVTIKK
ncbi:MAG: fibronectin type III domain-containing protein [Roseburia sp.]